MNKYELKYMYEQEATKVNTGIVKRYLEHKDRSFGKKKNMLDTFKTLWAFAKDNNLFGDIIPQDPTKEITFTTTQRGEVLGLSYVQAKTTSTILHRIS